METLTPDQTRVLSELADVMLAEEQAAAERQAAINAAEIAAGQEIIDIS